MQTTTERRQKRSFSPYLCQFSFFFLMTLTATVAGLRSQSHHLLFSYSLKINMKTLKIKLLYLQSHWGTSNVVRSCTGFKDSPVVCITGSSLHMVAS